MSAPTYKHHNGTTLVAEKSLGTRTILNTNHGITASVKREQWASRTEWTLTVVCNGIAESHETFTARRDAMAAYEALSR